MSIYKCTLFPRESVLIWFIKLNKENLEVKFDWLKLLDVSLVLDISDKIIKKIVDYKENNNQISLLEAFYFYVLCFIFKFAYKKSPEEIYKKVSEQYKINYQFTEENVRKFIEMTKKFYETGNGKNYYNMTDRVVELLELDGKNIKEKEDKILEKAKMTCYEVLKNIDIENIKVKLKKLLLEGDMSEEQKRELEENINIYFNHVNLSKNFIENYEKGIEILDRETWIKNIENYLKKIIEPYIYLENRIGEAMYLRKPKELVSLLYELYKLVLAIITPLTIIYEEIFLKQKNENKEKVVVIERI